MAAQYLAAAGKKYVTHKKDDSHTNMGWVDEKKSFVTHKFSNGDTLELSVCQMTLNWNGISGGTLNLNGARHTEILQWLGQLAKSNGLPTFEFDLHYTIDSGEFSDDLSYTQADSERCKELAIMRSVAFASCANTLDVLGLKGEVRTWPHHFDTGAYVSIPDSEIGVGFGLAIPDSMSGSYYLYTSGYKGHEGLSTEGLSSLTKGEWKNGDWKGAMLSVSELSPADYDLFFKESVSAFSGLVAK